MKNQLTFENYILRNGTNVTNEKLQALLFFSLIIICRDRSYRTLERLVLVKNNYVLISGSFERYQKYGEEVIPVPSRDMHITMVYEAHLDAVLKTYDRFDGKQLTKLIIETGLLENYDNDYLNMKDYWSYYKALIKKNLKLNRKEDIYRGSYFKTFNVFKWIYFSIVLLIIFTILILLSDEYGYELNSIIGLVNILNGIFIMYSATVYKTVVFTAFMRVERYKMEKLKLEKKL